MADTSVQTNNKLVTYRGTAQREKPRKSAFGEPMPPRSQAQARAMFAAKAGNSTLGIPKSVGAEFTADLKPGSLKKLPKRKIVQKVAKHEAAETAAKRKIDGMKRRGSLTQKASAPLDAKYGGRDQAPIDAVSR